MLPPILCYHKIDYRFELGFTQLTPRVFRRQVETLARHAYRVLGGEELARAVGANAAAGAQAVVFTFDDGYAGLAEHAFPVLAGHGFRALVFVITDFVGAWNTWDVQYGWRRFRHLSWDELGRWRERGIEVHSHGATHARLTWLSDAEITDEFGRSREEISRHLGAAPAGISYPFGATDERVCRLAAEAGYTLGFAGPAATGDSPLSLPRLPVYGWDRSGVPLVLRRGVAGALGRSLARFTNRCAVGTAAFQRVSGRRYARA